MAICQMPGCSRTFFSPCQYCAALCCEEHMRKWAGEGIVCDLCAEDPARRALESLERTEETRMVAVSGALRDAWVPDSEIPLLGATRKCAVASLLLGIFSSLGLLLLEALIPALSEPLAQMRQVFGSGSFGLEDLLPVFPVVPGAFAVMYISFTGTHLLGSRKSVNIAGDTMTRLLIIAVVVATMWIFPAMLSMPPVLAGALALFAFVPAMAPVGVWMWLRSRAIDTTLGETKASALPVHAGDPAEARVTPPAPVPHSCPKCLQTGSVLPASQSPALAQWRPEPTPPPKPRSIAGRSILASLLSYAARFKAWVFVIAAVGVLFLLAVVAFSAGPEVASTVGSVLLVLGVLRLHVGTNRDLQEKRSYNANLEAWDRANQLWTILFHCKRCEVVFLQGQDWYVPDFSTRQILYGDHQ